jgi:hypothetical protein
VAEAGDGSSLPQFVEREFREFLTCGVFEGGVARSPLTMRVPDAQDSSGEESVPSAGPLEGPQGALGRTSRGALPGA